MKYPIIVRLRNYTRDKVIKINKFLYEKVYKIKIGESTIISFGCKLDKSNPRGLVIGKYTYIARGAVVLTHDYVNRKHLPTTIGDNCFIGLNAIILPGVVIGNNVIVAAGSVVTKNMGNYSVVAGNPAKVIKIDNNISEYGRK